MSEQILELQNNCATSDALINNREMIEAAIHAHLDGLMANEADIQRRTLEFERDGYTKFAVNELVPDSITKAMAAEVNDLLAQFAIRRDLHLATTGHSPRYMSNVPQRFIEQQGTVIPTFYSSTKARAYLGRIVGDELTSCWKDEEYVINRLEKSGDTHGWHWGDYPYTIIWIIQAPPLDQGGILQCVPHTRWDKQNPRINWYLINNLIKSYFHVAGEAYLLRSDTTLHRVTPVQGENCTRIILNTCWASANDHRPRVAHETVDQAFV